MSDTTPDRDLEFRGKELLAELFCISPMFKLRDCLDGDFVIGCNIRCKFCLLRMFRASHTEWRNYFDRLLDEGRFVRLATPRGMIEFLKASKWFVPGMPMIIGGRSDANTQWADIKAFMPMLRELAPATRVFVLHRAPFPLWVADWMETEDSRQALLGTSITPDGPAMGTPVREQAAVAGLLPIVARHGQDRLSIEVRPVTEGNFDAAVRVLEMLADIGISRIIVGGLCFGGALLERTEQFAERGLVTEQILAALPRRADGSLDGADAIKNYVSSELEARFFEAAGRVGVTVWRKMLCFNQRVLGMKGKWFRENQPRPECEHCSFREQCEPKSQPAPAEVEAALADIGISGRVYEDNGVLRIANETPVSEDDLYWLFYKTGASPLVDGQYMVWPDNKVLQRWYAARFIDREAMEAAATL